MFSVNNTNQPIDNSFYRPDNRLLTFEFVTCFSNVFFFVCSFSVAFAVVVIKWVVFIFNLFTKTMAANVIEPKIKSPNTNRHSKRNWHWNWKWAHQKSSPAGIEAAFLLLFGFLYNWNRCVKCIYWSHLNQSQIENQKRVASVCAVDVMAFWKSPFTKRAFLPTVVSFLFRHGCISWMRNFSIDVSFFDL